MMKSSLLTACLILGYWSQMAIAQSSCQLVKTYSTAISGSIKEFSVTSACYRYKFESGSLKVINSLAFCINTKIYVYDSNNNKVADLCSANSFGNSGSAFYLDLNFGHLISYLNIYVSYSPTSNSTNGTSGSNTGNCGRPAVQPTISKIIGGTAARAHSWPWQVYLSIQKSGDYYMCGGSLIDNSTVLTAAHCIYDTESTDVTVYAGIHNVSEMIGKKGIVASRIIVHQNYGSGDGKQDDIALIKLNSSVTFGTNISPVCLPTSDLTATTGIVTGWGGITITASESANELMQVKIPIFPNSKKCGKEPITSKQFCAGYAAPSNADIKDSCFGDSGGPVVTRASANSSYVVDGIVSYGEKSICNGNGIYTRVYKYLDWIELNRY